MKRLLPLLVWMGCPAPPDVPPSPAELVLRDGFGQGVAFAGEVLPLQVSGAEPGAVVVLVQGEDSESCPASIAPQCARGVAVAETTADEAGIASLSLPVLSGTSPILRAATAAAVSATLELRLLDPEADDDGDGATNLDEARRLGTRVDVVDTDGDGLSDGEELHPLDPDWPDAWSPDPVRLSDPTLSVYDLEIDSLSHRILWAEDDGSEAWVAQLDLSADRVDPTDFRGELVATDIAAFATFQNGPEWLELPGEEASNVVYTQAIDGVSHIHRTGKEGGVWQSEVLAPGGAPLGSPWSEQGGGFIGFIGIDRESPNGLVSSWLTLDPVETTVSSSPLAALRFVPGAAEIVALRLEDGFSRVVVVDAETAEITPIATADENTITANGWFPPEHPGELHLTSSVGAAWGRETRIDIWRRQGSRWSTIKAIHPPAGTRMSVVRPLVVGDTSLVMFVATDGDAAELWVTSALPERVWSRRLVVDETRSLKDLEVAEDGDRVVILYRIQVDGIWQVHLVDVGPAERIP